MTTAHATDNNSIHARTDPAQADATRHNSPFAEFLMMAPEADKVVPMFHPQLLGEPVPVDGRMRISVLDQPGFGVELNPACKLTRPYTH